MAEELPSEIKEKVRKIDELIIKIYNYPAFTKYEEKEKAKEELIKLYKKETPAIKNAILLILHEKLSSAREFRDFHSFEVMKNKYRDEDGNRIRQRILRKIFDYSGSIDGIFETMDILGKFDDAFAMKLLAYHLSRYLLVNSFETTLFSEKILQVFGKSKCIYALRFLLSLAPLLSGKEKIFVSYLEALGEWAEKIDKLKGISKKEKERLKKELSEYVSVENEERAENYYG